MYYSGDKGEGGKKKRKEKKNKKKENKKTTKKYCASSCNMCITLLFKFWEEGEGEKEYVQNALDQISIIQKEKNQKEPYHLNRDRRAGA